MQQMKSRRDSEEYKEIDIDLVGLGEKLKVVIEEADRDIRKMYLERLGVPVDIVGVCKSDTERIYCETSVSMEKLLEDVHSGFEMVEKFGMTLLYWLDEIRLIPKRLESIPEQCRPRMTVYARYSEFEIVLESPSGLKELCILSFMIPRFAIPAPCTCSVRVDGEEVSRSTKSLFPAMLDGLLSNIQKELLPAEEIVEA